MTTSAPTLVATLLPAAVLLPLLGAVLAVLIPPRARRVAGLVGALATAGVAAGVVALVALAADGAAVTTALGGHAPPLGIALRADGISAVFLLLTAIVGAVVSVHAAVDPSAGGEPGARDWFWPAWLLAWAGLHAVFLSSDLFNLYVAVELVGLAAVVLVALGGPSAWRPAFRYLLVAVAGSLLLLLALTLVYAATGTLDLVLAGERLADGDRAAAVAVLALTAAGMALKSALFPVHGWLPGAHGSAPAAVSPLLSALVVKASFVVLVRVWTEVTGPDAAVGAVIGVAAAGSVLWGGLQALRAPTLKRLVAYSTISQLGYLFLYFPLTATARVDPADAWAAVATLAVAHGLAKASLFLAAGIHRRHAGTDSLDRLCGRASDLPAVTMAMGIASVSLAGLPVTLGFAGKWQLLLSAIGGGAWWAVVLLVVGTLVGAAYLLRPLQVLISGDHGDDDGIPDALEVPRAATVLPLVLAVIALVGVFFSGPLAGLATAGGVA